MTLSYELCQFSDPVSAHKNAVEKYFGKPTGEIYMYGSSVGSLVWPPVLRGFLDLSKESKFHRDRS